MAPPPHDAFFKSVFFDPEDARGEIVTLLPAEIVRRLQMDTLVLVPGSYVDEARKQSHTDLLFSVRLRRASERALIYVLVEHQSEPDRWMPLRLLRYLVRVWERWLEIAPPRAAHLPFIFPMVVHHGEHGWTSSTTMHGLFDFEDLPGAERFTPSFDFLLDDLARVDTSELRRRAMTVFARLALWFLRGARSDDLVIRELPEWRFLFRALLQGRHGDARALRLLSYYAEVNPVEFHRSSEAMLGLIGPALEPTMMTMADQLRAEGEIRGEAKGRADGLRLALVSILHARGLAATPEESSRIQSCSDLEALQSWVVRAGTVSAVADLFLGDPRQV